MTGLLEPKEAAKVLGISTATITRCVKRGAPVHRWGSTGRCYRINIPEFVEWMEKQGAQPETMTKTERMNVHAMAMARRASIASIVG